MCVGPYNQPHNTKQPPASSHQPSATGHSRQNASQQSPVISQKTKECNISQELWAVNHQPNDAFNKTLAPSKCAWDRTINHTTQNSHQQAATSHQPPDTQRKTPVSSHQSSAKKTKSAISTSSYEQSTSNQTMHSTKLGSETCDLVHKTLPNANDVESVWPQSDTSQRNARSNQHEHTSRRRNA